MNLRALVAPLALTTLFAAGPASAQVLVTELYPNTGAGLTGAEFVEIHNTGAAAVDISGWGLFDFSGAGTGRRYTFPASTSLAPGQVIIIARQATAYGTVATTNTWPAAVANFEFANGADDPTVPNMGGTGGNAFALNDTDDAVVLESAPGVVVSGVEFGATDRAQLAGSPVAAPNTGVSLGRIANTGSSGTDFAAFTTPNPGVGFTGPVSTPPAISLPTRAPANWAFGVTASFGATVTDPDGVGGVEFNVAIATSSAGTAAGNYVALPATGTGDVYAASGTLNNLGTGLSFAEPTGFHDRYVRWFVYGLDNVADDATLPANAVTVANNTAFFWENVLPANTVFSIADARAQGANERPLWEHHSVRVEGVALTTHQAFQTGTTNFFIASTTSVDAVRVFDDVLIAQTINPGDLVRVTGKIGVFRGVRQVGRDERSGAPAVTGSELTVAVVGSAPVPVRTLTVAGLLAAAEANESQLVEIAGLTLVTGPGGEPIPTTFTGNSSAYASDGTGTVTIRIASNIDLVGQAAPSGTFTLRGIVSQFAPTGTGGYQVQPRSAADVIGAPPPVDGGVNTDGGDPDAAMADTGVPPTDSGVPPTDSGVPPADSGVPPADSGVPPADSGVPPADSGVPPVDSGVADSGVTPADGGAGDAARPDTGIFGQGNGRDTDEGGCGCTTSAPARSGFDFAWAGLFGLAFFARRRRG